MRHVAENHGGRVTVQSTWRRVHLHRVSAACLERIASQSMSARSGFAFRLSAFQLLVSLVAERAIRRLTLCESPGLYPRVSVDSALFQVLVSGASARARFRRAGHPCTRLQRTHEVDDGFVALEVLMEPEDVDAVLERSVPASPAELGDAHGGFCRPGGTRATAQAAG